MKGLEEMERRECARRRRLNEIGSSEVESAETTVTSFRPSIREREDDERASVDPVSDFKAKDTERDPFRRTQDQPCSTSLFRE